MPQCGRRGGYFEIVNFDPEVVDQIYKLASIQLCPPLAGQIGVDILVRPPKEGEPSYELWSKEIGGIRDTLASRAAKMHDGFQSLKGVSCNEAQGALYLFPQIDLPEKAVKAAEDAGKAPDAFYCLELLKNTGICVVPGSGFGQKEGTLHFRALVLLSTIADSGRDDDPRARHGRLHAAAGQVPQQLHRAGASLGRSISTDRESTLELGSAGSCSGRSALSPRPH